MNRQPDKKRVSTFFIWLSLFFTAIPIISVVYFIIQTTIDVPFWDQWNWIPLLDKLFSGTLAFNDIWEPHYDDHRLFFPHLIRLVLAKLTHWDVRYELWMNVLFASWIFILFIKIIRRTFAPFSKKFIILLPSVSLFIFSLTQYENWIVGADMAGMLSTAAVTWGIYTLTKTSETVADFCIAILAAVIASFSFSAGFIFWLVGIWIILQWKKSWSAKRTFLLVWIIITILMYSTHIYSVMNSRVNSFLSNLFNPITIIEYVLIYVGRPITAMTISHIDLMIIGGILGFVSFFVSVVWLWRTKQKLRRSLVPYIAFAMFVLLNALITGLSRSQFGPAQAGGSRYTTITNLFWISNIVLFLFIEHYGFQHYGARGERFSLVLSLCAKGLFIMIIALSVFSSHRSAREFESFRNRFVIGRDKLLSGEVCIKEIFIHGYPPCEPEKINILKKYRLSTFRD